MLSGCSKKAYSCALSQTDADITHQPNLPLMPDELAGHRGDGRRSATVQQLSITHTVGACSYFAQPLSNGMNVMQVDWYTVKTSSYCLIHLPKQISMVVMLLLFLKKNQMSCEMWYIKYESINYIDHISQNNLSASHSTRLKLKSLPKALYWTPERSNQCYLSFWTNSEVWQSAHNYIIVCYKEWEERILELNCHPQRNFSLVSISRVTFGCVWEANGVWIYFVIKHT